MLKVLVEVNAQGAEQTSKKHFLDIFWRFSNISKCGFGRTKIVQNSTSLPPSFTASLR